MDRIEYDRAIRRAGEARSRAWTEGRQEWARLNGMAEREKGRYWCAHNLLGKRPGYEHRRKCRPASGLDIVWDHVRGFGRGRRPLVIAAWPYATPEGVADRLGPYAAEHGLRYWVGEPHGYLSLYGSATLPWLLTAPDVDPAELVAVTSEDLTMWHQRAEAAAIEQDSVPPPDAR